MNSAKLDLIQRPSPIVRLGVSTMVMGLGTIARFGRTDGFVTIVGLFSNFDLLCIFGVFIFQLLLERVGR